MPFHPHVSGSFCNLQSPARTAPIVVAPFCGLTRLMNFSCHQRLHSWPVPGPGPGPTFNYSPPTAPTLNGRFQLYLPHGNSNQFLICQIYIFYSYGQGNRCFCKRKIVNLFSPKDGSIFSVIWLQGSRVVFARIYLRNLSLFISRNLFML